MKYKYLTKEQIVISLDRLTRFKNTKDKYLRVFSDILLHCLIEPQIRKNDIIKMDLSELTDNVAKIFNESVMSLLGYSQFENSELINEFLKDYENAVYFNDSETQILLNNNINYDSAVSLITQDSPVNIKWLKTIIDQINKKDEYKTLDYIKLREQYCLKYPVEKIVLAEGITEEILLPEFAKYLGCDFYKKGVQIIPAGGKNQVVKLYYKLAEEVRLPIFILLDRDAEENITQITPKLRDIDKIHLVACGEFEDLLSKSLIVKTVNKHFENFLSISEQDLISENSTVDVLCELFKTKGLHEFKKAEFAKLIKDNITSDSDISSEIKEIISELSKIQPK